MGAECFGCFRAVPSVWLSVRSSIESRDCLASVLGPLAVTLAALLDLLVRCDWIGGST